MKSSYYSCIVVFTFLEMSTDCNISKNKTAWMLLVISLFSSYDDKFHAARWSVQCYWLISSHLCICNCICMKWDARFVNPMVKKIWINLAVWIRYGNIKCKSNKSTCIYWHNLRFFNFHITNKHSDSIA